MSVIEKNLNVQNGSVLKTFQILDCFTLEQPVQRIGDLCKKTGMNRSTIYRFMKSLNEIGIVVKEINGSFKLGIKLFELGIKVDVSASLAAKGYPFLKSLASSVQ
jgi:DNA-binding IclR family transcriptional regulator